MQCQEVASCCPFSTQGRRVWGDPQVRLLWWGGVLAPYPPQKTPLREQERPPSTLQLLQPAPNFQVAEGCLDLGLTPCEGWGQLSRLWQCSQVHSRRTGAGGQWVKGGAVAACWQPVPRSTLPLPAPAGFPSQAGGGAGKCCSQLC